jgi:hypothetical protein
VAGFTIFLNALSKSLPPSSAPSSRAVSCYSIQPSNTNGSGADLVYSGNHAIVCCLLGLNIGYSVAFDFSRSEFFGNAMREVYLNGQIEVLVPTRRYEVHYGIWNVKFIDVTDFVFSDDYVFSEKIGKA